MHAEKRQAEAARIRDKYPDRIPVSAPTIYFNLLSAGPRLTCGLIPSQVIVEKADKSDIPDIDKKK